MRSTKVKICGLTRLEDAQLAQSLGAWALGFIFYSESPRAMTPEKVHSIINSLRGSPPLSVGVFVNPTLEFLTQAVSVSGITAIQLHGNETREFCELVKKTYPKLKLIKAGRESDLNLENQGSDLTLIDSISESAWGGTGKVGNWKNIIEKGLKNVILAGGLTAENVTEAIRTVNPFAVDVSSGVENSPGIKSEKKLREFFKAVQST